MNTNESKDAPENLSPQHAPRPRDLRQPARLIAMARIGVRCGLDEAREALETLKIFRRAIQSQGRSDLDLERAQAVLQKIAMGYMPHVDDCVLAVQSLSARMIEKSLATQQDAEPCEVAA